MNRIAVIHTLRAVNVATALALFLLTAILGTHGHTSVAVTDALISLGNLGAYLLNGVTLRRLQARSA